MIKTIFYDLFAFINTVEALWVVLFVKLDPFLLQLTTCSYTSQSKCDLNPLNRHSMCYSFIFLNQCSQGYFWFLNAMHGINVPLYCILSLQNTWGVVGLHEKPGHYLLLLLWKYKLGTTSENSNGWCCWCHYAYFRSVLRLMNALFIRVGLTAVTFSLQHSMVIMNSSFVCTHISNLFLSQV